MSRIDSSTQEIPDDSMTHDDTEYQQFRREMMDRLDQSSITLEELRAGLIRVLQSPDSRLVRIGQLFVSDPSLPQKVHRRIQYL